GAVDPGAQQIPLVADEAAVVAQAHLAAPARFDCLLGIERREPDADVVGVFGRRGWHRGGRLRALLRPHRSLPARFLPWLLGLLCLGSRTNGFLRLRGLLGSLLRLRLDCGPFLLDCGAFRAEPFGDDARAEAFSAVVGGSPLEPLREAL